MNLTTMFKVTALVAGLFGLFFLVAPATAHSLWGEQADVVRVFHLRQLGSAFVGFAIIAWHLAVRPYSETTWTVGMAFCVFNAISTLIALNQVFVGSGIYAMRWVTVVIYGLLTVGFLTSLLAAKRPTHSVA